MSKRSVSSRSAFTSPFGNPFSPRATQKANKRYNYNSQGMRVIKNPTYRNGMRPRRSKRNELNENTLFEDPLKELIETINKNLNQLKGLVPKSVNNINAIERELNEIKKNIGIEYEIFENV